MSRLWRHRALRAVTAALVVLSSTMSAVASANSVQSAWRDALQLYETTGSGELNYLDSIARKDQAEALLESRLTLSLDSGLNRNSLTDRLRDVEADTDVRRTRTALGLTRPLYDAELRYAAQAAGTDQKTAAVARDQEKQSVAEEATLRFLELQVQNEVFLLSQQKYRRLSTELSRVDKLVSKGFSAEIDKAEVLLEIERAKLEIFQGHKNLALARSNLFRITGKVYTPPVSARRYESVDPAWFRVNDLATLTNAALAQNFDLRLLQSQRQAANQRFASAQAASGFKLSLQGELAKTLSRDDLDRDEDDASVGLRLEKDLTLFGGVNAHAAQSARYQSELQRQRENLKRVEVESQLRSLHAEYESGVKSFVTLRQLLTRSQRKIEFVRKALELGTRREQDVYTAIVENFSINESMVRQFYELLAAQVRMNAFTGSLDEPALRRVDEILRAAG